MVRLKPDTPPRPDNAALYATRHARLKPDSTFR
jgi:hypothetical protein